MEFLFVCYSVYTDELMSEAEPLYRASFPGLPCFCSLVCVDNNTRKPGLVAFLTALPLPCQNQRELHSKRQGRPANHD